jgi:uncharacterized protein YjbI with pentapeptide repeats
LEKAEIQMRPRTEFTLSDGSPLTPQEQFVLKQAAAGEIADLKEKFGDAEENRRLRARFLEELLTGDLPGVRMHRRGVRISQAVIQEPLDLENVEVPLDVGLEASIFKESFSIGDACFNHNLSLSSSHFLKRANFHRLNLAGGMFCRNTVFAGPVDFAGAEINGQFGAKGAKFLSQLNGANFNGMKVVGLNVGVRLECAEFHGPVNFTAAEIGGQFVAQVAKFLSQDYEANFNGMKVGLDAFFDEAEFHGPVDFGGADIKGQFGAEGAKFLASDHKADFHRMEVGQDAFFKGCDFHGLVSFVLVKIAGDLHLEPLQLKSGQEMSTTFHSGVNFRGAEIGGELLADKAQFLGHLNDFEAVKVGHSFHASGAIFAGSAYFAEMAVQRNFFLDPFGRLKSFKTLFKGAADFSRLEVGGVFNADQAIFKSESTIFSGLKVGQGAFFIGTIFFGGLVLKEGQLTDLVIRGLHPLSAGGLPLEEIVLNRTRIEHRLTLENMEVKRFEARNLEVKGPAELLRLAIKHETDLHDASLYHLELVEPDWPAPQDGHQQVYLDGLTYQSLTTRSEPRKAEKWQELLEWLQQSRFNTQNYLQLDGFFQRAGLREWADKTYIAGKRRELGRLPWWHPGRWLPKVFWDWPAGFGRKPGRTFWPALVLVLLGWLVFHAAGQPLSDGLAVSLDRFLPGVDLGVARAFQPASASNWVWLYWYSEKIMGWVLAPITLAAIYTRIK